MQTPFSKFSFETLKLKSFWVSPLTSTPPCSHILLPSLFELTSFVFASKSTSEIGSSFKLILYVGTFSKLPCPLNNALVASSAILASSSPLTNFVTSKLKTFLALTMSVSISFLTSFIGMSVNNANIISTQASGVW